MIVLPFFAAATSADSAVLSTAHWLEGLLLGGLGTSIAVLAVAGLGLSMLQGRLPVRHGLRVVLGLFILFGAPLIASGLADIGSHDGPASAPLASAAAPQFTRPPSVRPNSDPYAGASVPMHNAFDPYPVQ